MTIINEKSIKKDGYTLHIVKTDKFKTNMLVWKMRAPLTEDTVTLRALLPNVLESSTKQYPTTTALRSHLDELYGANFFVDLSKKGENHIMSFTVEIANEKFLKDTTPLLQKGIDFLTDVILHPNVENGAFHADTVEKEKRNLKQRIQSIYNNKMRFANKRLIAEMCKEEPYALDVNGKVEKVDEITAKTLFDYYRKALAEDELDLYVIGDVDEQQVSELCEEQLSFDEREPLSMTTKDSVSMNEVKEIKDNQDVKQGKLNIGYRTNIRYGDDDYFALQVFNGIFGGFSHSKLFINVREKASLAYYASSQIESHKGLLIVMSGIEFENYEKTTGIIRKQMEAMKTGDFSEVEIEQTKAVIKNQLLETIDTARGSVEVLYHNVIANETITIDDWLQRIDEVKKEDIIAVAEKINLDTVYFLTGLEEDEA